VPHAIDPAGQTHAPALHVWPAAQAVPHAPQSLASLARSTHACPHFARPAAQLAAQAPTLQTSPLAQVFPQAPQFNGSCPASTHAPAHES
jgi:hypothetical protein